VRDPPQRPSAEPHARAVAEAGDLVRMGLKRDAPSHVEVEIERGH
jgi:hypothetical protein